VLLPRFALHAPRTVGEAVDLLGRHGEDATVYAGGTELLLAMKLRILRYGHLIDVKRIPELGDIAVTANGSLAVGALATHHTLERHPLLVRHAPAYAALSRAIANVRVRVAGTIGGNLCFAEPHADPPALLAALGAAVRLVGPHGHREVPVGEFVQGAFDTARRPDEVLTRVTIPLSPAPRSAAYERFAHLERPTAGAAVVLTLAADRQRIATASVWVGAVGPRPAPVPAVAEPLAGAPVAALGEILPGAARRGAEACSVDEDIHGSEDYKRHLVQVLIERAVRRAAEPRAESRAG
jgi:aerobic carbon-monoxide dehydrogenase medium subunit